MSDYDYGFNWGPMEVQRVAHIEKRGYVLFVTTDHRRLEVFVSEKGRSVRCWLDGKLLVEADNE